MKLNPITTPTSPQTAHAPAASTQKNNGQDTTVTPQPRLLTESVTSNTLRSPATSKHNSTEQSQEAAAVKLQSWVENCPNESEQRNWKAVADQMRNDGVYLDQDGRYVIDGDLFANDFTGIIATHSPMALPDNLTVTGKLDLNFFSGLRELPRGLRVGESLVLTGIQDVLNKTKYPVIENGRIINADTVAQHRANALNTLSEKFAPKVRQYMDSNPRTSTA